MRSSLNSEMCTRPSTPGSSSANAPNWASFVILAGTVSPTWYLASMRVHGFSSTCFRLRPIFLFSRSTVTTRTSISWPTRSTCDGCWTCPQDSSDRWISPSAPPRSTNAPKSVNDETRPWRTSPACNSASRRSFCWARRSCAAARSERMSRLRRRFISMTLR